MIYFIQLCTVLYLKTIQFNAYYNTNIVRDTPESNADKLGFS